MGRKLNIEQLFASKLEGLEQTPSPSVWKKTARTVRRKQFFRFRPGRMNIYYLAGMAVVGTAIAYYVTAGDMHQFTEGAEETAEHVVKTTKDAKVNAEGVGSAENAEDAAMEGRITAADAENAQEAAKRAGNAGEVETTTGAKGNAAGKPNTAVHAKANAAENGSGNDAGGNAAGVETAKETAGNTEEATTTNSAAGNTKEEAKAAATGPPAGPSEEAAPEEVSTMIPYFTPSVQSGCAPLTVTFINTSANAAEYDWDVGFEMNTTNLRSPVVTYTDPGTYTVTLTATDRHGMTKSHSTIITVYPSPVAKYTFDQGNIYNYSTDAGTFAWYLVPASRTDALPAVPDAASLSRLGLHPFSTSYQPSGSEVIDARQHNVDDVHLLLVAINASGCMDTAMRRLPLPASPELVFPTVFSPNPDGSIGGYFNPNHPNNQVFHPQFSEQPASYHLQVFNKAGELLFETTDIYIGWDGYYQEAPAPRGVYIYQVTGTWKNGDSFQYRGDVTIL
ncbi:MAG: gliding motility-associated C-terminal domain-containing protein [Bacteroidales bacterium]|nr:gliding motility-associated C-terminal domain-containing protein [Bacteroidales bacterium]